MKKDIRYGVLYYTLNTEQKRIFDKIVAGENIFITGNAGTGKSYLLKAFDEYCEMNNVNLVKTAPTGVAAMEIGGATLHRQFCLKVGIDTDPITEDKVLSNKRLNFLKKTDVLFIDEISPVRIDTFDKVMQILKFYNESKKRKKKPIQLILCGDFFQLAPVISREEKAILEKIYEGLDVDGGYAFQSKYWNMYDIHTENLTQVMRQEDKDFCRALDECRNGDSHCIEYLTNHSSHREIENAIWLCGKNTTAKMRNDAGLASLDSKMYISQARYSGEVTDRDGLCEDRLFVKVGARVLMTVNSPDKGYQNGSTGTIKEIKKSSIMVLIDGTRRRREHLVEVEPHEFCRYKYEAVTENTPLLDENGQTVLDPSGKPKTTRNIVVKKKEVGKAVQFPMKLGYAITIHKAQGQTYERMNLEPEIWDCGQLYVALSRCRTIEGIYINGKLTNRMFKTSAAVKEYYGNIRQSVFTEPGSFEDEQMEQLAVPRRFVPRIKELIEKWQEEETAVLSFFN